MIVVLIALATSPADAGGYYYPDSGIVANGRGCAFVAGADNQFAQYYNPAGLVRMQYPTVNLGASGVRQAISFARLNTWTDDFDETVRNEGAYFAVPEIGFASPILKDKLAFAVGFTSAFAPDYVYPSDGPQRYSMIDSLIWNFQVGPSIAYRPIKYLAVGASFQWQVLRVEERLSVTTTGFVDCTPAQEDAGQCTGSEYFGFSDPAGDVLVDAAVWDAFTPSANVGILIEPIPELSIGVSFQPPIRFEARGHGQLDFTGNGLEPYLDQAVWTDDDIGLNLDMPMFLRTGVAVRPVEPLEVEVDFVYEAWSSLEDIIVNDIDVTVTGDLGLQQVQEEIELPAGFNDAWSIRLGAEYEVIPELDVRAGGFYETSALKEDQVSVALVDSNKFMVGTGATVHTLGDRLLIDTYASVVAYRALEIRSSKVDQIDVLEPLNPAIVGNGDIKSFGSAFGAALRWQFKKASSAPL